VDRPIVAIAGSIDSTRSYDPPLRDVETAAKACIALGRELARQGCDIVVYSGDRGFTEPYVVQGYVASGQAQPGSIHVRAPLDTDLTRFPDMESRRELFDVRLDSGAGWEVAYYRSLVDADGLLLVGGGRSTVVTGLIGLTFGIPLLAVACFGGGAQRVWAAMDQASDADGRGDVSQMAEAWHDGSAAALVEGMLHRRQLATERAEQARMEEVRRSRRSSQGLLIAAVLLILGVASLPVSFAWSPTTATNVALLAFGPMLAAAAGALIRSTLDGAAEHIRPAVLGLAAGGISAVLFIAAQLATTPAAIDGSGGQRLLFFVVPVGFIAGLTSDAVYAKLRGTDVANTSAVQRPSS
jgi:putative copper export protein